jgi:cytochrome c oxidase cbb3-type subunit III
MKAKFKIIGVLLMWFVGFSLQASHVKYGSGLIDKFDQLYQKVTSVSVLGMQIQDEITSENDSSVESVENIIYAPNYNKNFKIFLVLITIGAVLILAIFITLDSARNLTSSEYFKSRLIAKYKKIRESNTPKVLLALSMSGFAASAFAAGGSEPWLKISKSDLYWIAGLDVALFFTYLYVRNYVQDLINEIKTKEELALAEKLSRKSSVGYILTKSVELDEEHTIMMDHEYDGIRELDNDLPPWWKWGFYVTIVWSVIYLFHFHIIGTGDLQAVEYEKSVAKAEIEISAYLAKAAMNVDEKTATVMIESKDLTKGGALFKQYCAVCHGQLGEGGIGPNLTDDYWLYGNDVKEIFGIIKYGAKNGMKSWKDEMNPVEMQQVASYILHMAPAEGKEPQGDKLDRKPLLAAE